MKSVEIGALVGHQFYDSIVGEVLDINKRFGVLVRWQSEDRKMAHICREPRRHLAQHLVLASEWKSIQKTNEGLSCVDDEEADDEESENKVEVEVPDIVADEPVTEEPIPEAVNSDPLPAEEEAVEDLEEQYDD